MSTLAPFPWFGGKSRVAHDVWPRLGDPDNYVEPFAGSLAVLLARPETRGRRTETINDLDGFVANFWRAVTEDPEAVAFYADWPVNENDLHARHAYLVTVRPTFSGRMEGDPEFYDPKIAGWWVWGVCASIAGWCSGDGPWQSTGGQLVKIGNAGRGINRSLPHLGNAGQGINRSLPHLGNAGQGIKHWFITLATRLRNVRVTCGDWSRIMGESVTTRHGTTAVFLDPPYGEEIKQTRVYAADSGTVSDQVRDWCVENGNDRRLRIALCGYAGEGHDVLIDHGWTAHAWRTAGGYGGGRGTTGDLNRHLERIYFSPACAEPAQGVLDFGEPA